MRVLLLGPPGAGKGTQGRRLADRHVVAYIASGDLFRTNVQQGTELGLQAKGYMDAGELVPDDVTIRMVMEAVASAGSGFVLDGFPRTRPQAERLDEELDGHHSPLDAVLLFAIDDDDAVARVAGRLTCERCGTPFNLTTSPPAVAGVCDRCGGRLVQRSDESAETVRHRLEVYRTSTAPLVDFYRERGILREIDARGTEDEVTDRAVAALDALGEHPPAGVA